MKRITRVDGRKVTSPFNSEANAIPIKPAPIDLKFIENYYDVPLDYAKAGDTIYMVMAKKLGLPLITMDQGMYSVAKRSGISVFTIEEALRD